MQLILSGLKAVLAECPEDSDMMQELPAQYRVSNPTPPRGLQLAAQSHGHCPERTCYNLPVAAETLKGQSEEQLNDLRQQQLAEQQKGGSS